MKNPFNVRKIADNTYIIEQKTKYFQCLTYLLLGREKALLIDTGVNEGDLKGTVDTLTNLPVIVVCTHGHLDHIGCAWQFGGALICEADDKLLENHLNQAYLKSLMKLEYSPLFCFFYKRPINRLTTPPPVTLWGHLPETIDLGERTIEVINTPGHTPGSVCFLDRKNRMLFSGDTICDWGILLHLEGTGIETYLQSIKKIKAIENDFDDIWPGHHGAPVKRGTLDSYIACAEGVISGDIEPVRHKRKQIATYEGILITLKP
ncbi:MAG: MBL fold metallo-hydrolase [Lachnospiraceae bacterium]|jgi:glyoxylase-like metal-dependent hydrolase (beta-lactamase superfamily II)|nr:MBL fold metallo-hydrolase [Lachnospiraceae bacterium]